MGNRRKKSKLKRFEILETKKELKKRLEKVRREIDSLDRKILPLIAKRYFLVKKVTQIKQSKQSIVDKGRIAEIVKRIRVLANKKNMNPADAEKFWRIMIGFFINIEKSRQIYRPIGHQI